MSALAVRSVPVDVLAILERSTFSANAIKLPEGKLAPALYRMVAKWIEKAGGKWDKRAQHHAFPSDPRESLGLAVKTGKLDLVAAAQRNYAATQGKLARLQPLRGEAREKIEHLRAAGKNAASAQEALTLMRTLSHVPNFFPTPPAVLRELLEAADVRPGQLILEPSAGKGDIVKALIAAGAEPHCYEINYTLAQHVASTFDLAVGNVDFLTARPNPVFDRVIMNPPFERGVDERHVLHAFEFLKPGGRLVSVVCSTTAAKLGNWADEVIALPAGSFKTSERSTGVNTALVIKDKI